MIWIVVRLEGCGGCPGYRNYQGAFSREEDAIGYGVWLMTYGKLLDCEKIEITRMPLAPPGAMYPPETVH